MRLLAFLSFLLCVAPSVVQAGIYDVTGIQIKAQGATPAQARTLALRQGQLEALEIILRRLALQEDWGRLPDVASLDFQATIDRITLDDEKTIGRTYSATLFVAFAAQPLRQLFQELDIPLSETQSRSALLIPVLEDTEGLQVWERNWWRTAWGERDLSNIPSPLMLAAGDIQDRAVSAEDIVRGHPVKLARLNQRYNTQTTIVAHALAGQQGRLGVTLYIFGAEENDVLIRNYAAPTGAADVASTAVSEFLLLLGERWKSQTPIDNETHIATIAARFEDLPSWLRIQAALARVVMVRSTRIVEISPPEAVLEVSFRGSTSALSDHLDRQGLRLLNSETGDDLALELK